MDTWQFGLRDLIDIALVAAAVYFILRMIRGTRAVQMLIGLAVVFLVYEAARIFGLLTVEWIFGQFFSAFIIIFVVLFQHEIRRGLVRMAVNPLSAGPQTGSQFVEALTESAFALSHRKWGGLLVIERETGLKHLYDSGVEMRAALRPDVIQSIFCPHAPMHDGAVIVRSDAKTGYVAAARVLLPLAQANALDGGFGTRHRAAVGLTEESDALVIIISEENGEVRLAEEGVLTKALAADALRRTLTEKVLSNLQQRGVYSAEKGAS